MQGAVCQGAQKEPGQLSDVGHALDEFFRPVKKIQFYRSHLSCRIRSHSSGLFTRSQTFMGRLIFIPSQKIFSYIFIFIYLCVSLCVCNTQECYLFLLLVFLSDSNEN